MSNLIIVESKNDKYFLEAFIENLQLQNLKIDEPICNINEFNCLGGIDKLNIKLADIRFDEYNKIGIILDADEIGIKSRIAFINDALKNICDDVVLENINQLKRSEALDLEIVCYIMNIEGKGELETVQREVKSKDSTYADCLESWRDCLESKEIFIKQKEFDKIWVSNYLKYDTCISSKHRGSKNRYCSNELINNTNNKNEIENNLKSNSDTLKKDIWNFEHPALSELKAFLKLLN